MAGKARNQGVKNSVRQKASAEPPVSRRPATCTGKAGDCKKSFPSGQPTLTWHRIGWSSRNFHTTAAREARCQLQQNQLPQGHMQQQLAYQQHKQPSSKFWSKPEQQRQLCALQQQCQQQQQQQRVCPVVLHTHSCTFMHSQKHHHTHKTTLVKCCVPGQNGMPEAQLNTDALCDELNTKLFNTDRTLLHLLTVSQQPAAATNTWSAAAAAAAGSSSSSSISQQKPDNEAIRQQLAISLEKQMAFSTACLLEWCGRAPEGSGEQVLQQLLQP